MSYLTTEQAADYLGYSIHTLAVWRQKRTGPRFHKVMGRSIRYKRADLDEWMHSYGGEVCGTDQQSAHRTPRLRLRL